MGKTMQCLPDMTGNSKFIPPVTIVIHLKRPFIDDVMLCISNMDDLPIEWVKQCHAMFTTHDWEW